MEQLPQIQFVSLQKGPTAHDYKSSLPNGVLIDLTAHLTDFADTAALIANLDLIIAVDTAVAHLADSMAKPVWLMLTFAPDWRWMLDRTNSPWYPTARLFRQSQPGDWIGVINRVITELTTQIKKHICYPEAEVPVWSLRSVPTVQTAD